MEEFIFFFRLWYSMEKLIALFCLEKTLHGLEEIKCQPSHTQDVFIVRTRKFFHK